MTTCSPIWARRFGAALLLVLIASEAPAAERPPIDTLRQLGPALLACWRPPGGVGDFDVRVRFSLKRDGAVLGRPRIVFARFVGGPGERRVVIRSVLDALAACTPVPLTPGLGGAIAGRPLTVGFAPPSLGV